jgi:hypothetical protein
MSSFASAARNPFVPARMKAITGALLVLLALSACSSIPTAQDLMGMWESVPTGTGGASAATYCFSKDGSVEWISQVQGRTHRVRGTFKLAGDVLTIESADLDAPAALKAKMTLGKLELTSPSGSAQKYTKVAGSCDDNGR